MKFRNGVLISILTGIIIGILTVLGQGVLPGSWNSIANSGVSWLLPAYFIGAMGSTKTKSALFSILSLLGMVVGYYGYEMLIQNVPHSIYFILVWTGAAIIGGTIFGIAGYLWRSGKGYRCSSNCNWYCFGFSFGTYKQRSNQFLTYSFANCSIGYYRLSNFAHFNLEIENLN